MESRGGWLAAAVGLIFLFLSNPLQAQDITVATDPDTLFERQILARLVKINPPAAPLFEEASRFYYAGQYDKAKEGFEAVLQLAPDFPDAERRLGFSELQLGDSATALFHAERAYSADPSPYNQSALAQALVAFRDSSRYPEAFAYAESAAISLPDKVAAQMALLQSGMVTFNEKAVQTASQRLVRLAPEYPLPHYFYGIALAQNESWEASERELLKAQSLGVPQEAIEGILAQGIRTHATTERWKRRGIFTLVAWLAALALLFLLGALLSKITLGAVARTQRTGTFHVSRPERKLRTLYRGVIAITSVYFYLSIPILLVIVLTAAGAFFYLLLQVGRIPIKLAAFVAIATLVTVYAILRSMFVRPRNTDPGRRIDREQAPGLWAVTEEVAAKVQTRPIEAIFVTPGAEIAVMERGGGWQKLQGKGNRCLILGLAALPGLRMTAFKSILAHEYGHFSNRDTAGGNLANQTNRSMYQMALTLAENGLTSWYNPAWWFLRGFNTVFLRVTLGASRLQEILADRIAVLSFGVKSFITGLTLVIRQNLSFQMQLSQTWEKNADSFNHSKNLYALPPIDSDVQKQEIETKLSEILNRPSSIYDSHPAPCERFKLIEKLDCKEPEEENLAEVIQLLPHAEELQCEMTAIIQKNFGFRQISTAPQ